MKLKTFGLPEDVIERLYDLRGTDGDLQSETVVEDARDDSSPLHNYFTWDDSEAAEKYRLFEAGNLIRRVKVEVIDSDDKSKSIQVRAFVASETIDGHRNGYRAVETIMDNHDNEAVLKSIQRDIDRLRRKYKGYESLFDLVVAEVTTT